jgi:hypothetical protein
VANRDLALVLVGGTVNNVGDWMLTVALPVYIYVETGSGLATAAVFFIELVIGVGLGPFGGVSPIAGTCARHSSRPTSSTRLRC